MNIDTLLEAAKYVESGGAGVITEQQFTRGKYAHVVGLRACCVTGMWIEWRVCVCGLWYGVYCVSVYYGLYYVGRRSDVLRKRLPSSLRPKSCWSCIVFTKSISKWHIHVCVYQISVDPEFMFKCVSNRGKVMLDLKTLDLRLAKLCSESACQKKSIRLRSIEWPWHAPVYRA